MMRHIFYALLMLPLLLKAEVGCMDNSKYANTYDGYDYKKYHLVYCSCPCDRYFHAYNRGRCEKCLHFRAPKQIQWKRWQDKCYSFSRTER
ncbi:MAG: hypothetical protein AB7R69_01565 [Candidatus Babeliales bacterium]